MKAPSSSKYDYSQMDTDWHLTVAWIPVKINEEWYWMIDVMRRRVYDTHSVWASRWEYRLPTIADKQRFIDRNK